MDEDKNSGRILFLGISLIVITYIAIWIYLELYY